MHTRIHTHVLLMNIYVVHIIQTESDSPFTTNNLRADTGTDQRLIEAEVLLEAFGQWANDNQGSLADYDHAMLFTA